MTVSKSCPYYTKLLYMALFHLFNTCPIYSILLQHSEYVRWVWSVYRILVGKILGEGPLEK
jgi:hypothetical protein